jgi:hypothetical protein
MSGAAACLLQCPQHLVEIERGRFLARRVIRITRVTVCLHRMLLKKLVLPGPL